MPRGCEMAGPEGRPLGSGGRLGLASNRALEMVTVGGSRWICWVSVAGRDDRWLGEIEDRAKIVENNIVRMSRSKSPFWENEAILSIFGLVAILPTVRDGHASVSWLVLAWQANCTAPDRSGPGEYPTTWDDATKVIRRPFRGGAKP